MSPAGYAIFSDLDGSLSGRPGGGIRWFCYDVSDYVSFVSFWVTFLDRF